MYRLYNIFKIMSNCFNRRQSKFLSGLQKKDTFLCYNIIEQKNKGCVYMNIILQKYEFELKNLLFNEPLQNNVNGNM